MRSTTSVGSELPWVLVREFGIEYASGCDPEETVDLSWPVVAERISGNAYLIVDECPVFSIPPRTDCRTLIILETREVVYNSKANGIEDGYGCRMDDEHFAILCRTRREILVISRSGVVVRCLPLPSISNNPPRILCWTHRGTFLVNFLARGQPFDVVELDIHGRVLWSLIGRGATVGMSASMQLLANDSILVANEASHVVQELHRDGSISIRWGKLDVPSAKHGYLFGPKWAQELNDGTLLIADAYNHRCLAIDTGGHVSDIGPSNGSFFVPSFITRLRNNNFLICDAGLGHIFELDKDYKTVSGIGALTVRKRCFSFPRSVHYSGRGKYLVADTANNRIVEFDGCQVHEIPVNSHGGLFWPRAARRTGHGTLLVADGRNSRILELTAEGHVLRLLDRVQHQGRVIELQDPHDIRQLPNKNLLITDSAQNLVLETDWDGRIAWVVGLDSDPPLDDPHSAQLLSDGRVMIADSGNHRILFVDPKTRVHNAITDFPTGTARCRMNYPRYAEMADDGTLVIVDSLNNRVMATGPSGELLWELSCVADSPIPLLHFPRWAHLINRDEIVVSDNFNHRILHLRRQVKSQWRSQ